MQENRRIMVVNTSQFTLYSLIGLISQLTYFFFSCTEALKFFISIYLNIAFLPPFYICFSASFSLSLIWFKAVLRTFKLTFYFGAGSDFA